MYFQLHNDLVTADNKDFLKEVVKDKYNDAEIVKLNEQDVNVQWTPKLRRTGLIARKIGVYPLWLKNGKKITTTLLQVS